MAEKLRTQKKTFIALMEGALVKHMPVGEARRLAKAIYPSIRDEIGARLVLEPMEGITRTERKDTICETLRAAYHETDIERVRAHLRQAYDYAQRMNERLQYYYRREPFMVLMDEAPKKRK